MLGPGEDRGAAVVEQNDMEALRAVAGRDAGPKRGVGIHALAGGGASQELEHDLDILETGQHLLDSGQGNQGAGQRKAHAAVALGLNHHDRAGFGDEEVGAADGRRDGQKLLAEISACRVGQNLWVVGEVLEPHAPGEDFAHLRAIDVQSGDDDVRGFFFAQLQDDFCQVGFENADARGLEKGIQLNLGRGHGLDLDDLDGVFLAQQVEDDLARLGGIGGPVDLASGGGTAGFELFEISVEVLQGMCADGRGCLTQFLPIRLLGDQFAALGLDHIDGMSHVLAQLGVAQHG